VSEEKKPEAPQPETAKQKPLKFNEKFQALTNQFTAALREVPEVELALVLPIWSEGLSETQFACYRCDPKNYGDLPPLQLASINQLQKVLTIFSHNLGEGFKEALNNLQGAQAEAEEHHARTEILRAEIAALERQRTELVNSNAPHGDCDIAL
jgi:hypothetical protein